MAGIALSAILALSDPAPSWRFVVTLPPIISSTSTTTANIYLGPEYVMHFDLPMPHIMPEDEHWANSYRYHPTNVQVDDINLSLYVDSNYSALNYMEAWRQLIFNMATGNIGLPVDFKKTIKVDALDVEGNKAMTAMCFQCWPTSRMQINYDGSHASQPIAMNVTLKCERIEYTFNSIESLSYANAIY
jgi:hypothetical protein